MRLRGALVATLAVAALAAVPSPAAARTVPPTLSVRSALLADGASGQWLYGVQPNRELPIASTTKLMTALITLEHARLDRVFSYPGFQLAAADSQIGLQPGERMTVHDLLIALLVPSADDAAEDLAYNVGRRSIARFVGMMNSRSRQLGLLHTHYSTPVGLDTLGNYSSASDLLKLARYLLSTQRFFARAVAMPSALLRSGSHPRVVLNRNDLVGRLPWVKGIKTGHTLGAGYVLVALGVRHGMRLLSAVLGTASAGARDANTLALLGYGFGAFREAQPVRRGAVLARPAVGGRPGMRAAVVAASSLRRVIARQAVLSLRIEVPHILRGPLPAGTTVGSVVAFAGRTRLGRVRLVLARAVPAPAASTLVGRVLRRGSTLVLLVVLIAAGLGLPARRRRRGQRSADDRSPSDGAGGWAP